MLVLVAMVFVVASGYGAGLPLVQPYLRQYLESASPATLARHVGLLGGIYTLALFLFAPWWGRQSDARGRTSALVTGYALFLAGTAAAALAPSLWAVYLTRFLAGAGAAAIVPGAQAYIADISSAGDRSRRFVLLGSASFVGLLAGPVLGSWLAGPVMGMVPAAMPGMVNWPALAVAILGAPLLVAAPPALGRPQPVAPDIAISPAHERQRFIKSSMGLALLASFAAGIFEVGFSLFGGQTLGLPSGTMAVMFITCSLAMLAAQGLLLLAPVRQRIDQRWVAGAFALGMLAVGFAALFPGAVSLGLLIGVVATAVGMIGPVLSYELLERERVAVGVLLGRQAAAGNLGQALGAIGSGLLFAWHALAPFWATAFVLLAGAVASLLWWGPARAAEMARAGPATGPTGRGASPP